MANLIFRVFQGDELVSVESFDREIIKIGRLSSAHLRLTDEKVSRIHAVIEISAKGAVHIIDMGSIDGTFVNGERVNKSIIQPGDEIRLGDTRLLYGDQEATSGSMQVEELVPSEDATLAEDDLSPEETTAETRMAAAKETAPGFPPHRRMDAVEESSQEFSGKDTSMESALGETREGPEGSFVQRVALPLPAHVGDLDDVGGTWSLEVRKIWGDTVLNVKTFGSEQQKVVLGSGSKADFYLPADLLPADNFPLVQLKGSDVMMSISPSATGNFTSEGQVIDLRTWSRSRDANPDPAFSDCRLVSLPKNGVATIAFGNVSFRVKHVEKPEGFCTKFTERLDYTLLNSLLLLFFSFAALVATFYLRPESVETSEEELYKVPDRFVQFILTRPKPQKTQLDLLARLKTDMNKSGSAARHKGAEGKMGIKGKASTGKRSAVRAIRPDDKEVVGNRGLLAVLGQGGTSGLSTVTGGTGLGGELEGAIGNMYGSQIGNSGGFGGLGIRGTGPGGGGVSNTIGVGRLGTRGRGGGRQGYGSGVSKIRKRSERNINISMGRPVIMGSLSMDVIRRVIHSHRDQIRYCYNKELTRHPNLAGKIPVKFTISPKGYVQSASVRGSTMRNRAVEHCITQKIRTWKFPEPKGGGIVIVNYPFIFTSSSD
jgi:hypothetical protein